MKTLNDITRKYDNDTFDCYRNADLPILWHLITDTEREELRKRLEELEKRNENGEEMIAKADGFTDEEYEEFEGKDLFDEMLKLRSMNNLD